MIGFLINALAAGNFKSSQDGVKGQELSRSLRCNLRSVGKAGVKQAGSPSCSPSAPPQARSSSPESDPDPIEWSIAPPTTEQRLKHRHALFEFPSVDGGQLARLRTIIVVVDQLSRAALQATISPYTRSVRARFDRLDLDVGLQGKGCDHVGVFTLTANRLTIESFSLPVRLSATTSLCASV